MSARLWRDLGHLAWSWYSQDRIRTSPAEGRLLRVRAGDLLTIGCVDATVVDRSISNESTGLCVRLTCSTETGIGELQLNMTDQGTPHLIWIEAGRRCEMTTADVQVWPRNR